MKLLRAVTLLALCAGAAARLLRPVAALVPEPARADPDPVRGQPRFVLPQGGTVRSGRGRPDQEDVLLLPAGRSVIGRGPTADLRLREPTLSPEHLEVLVRADGETVIRDLDSLNGVRVNGVPVREAALVDANRVDLGAAMLVFHRDDADDGGRQGGELGERYNT